MSYSVDVGLLLYASDRSSRFHQPATDFLAVAAASPELLCLAWPTLLAYLRIATHPAVFTSPLAPEEAEANVEALVRLPQVRLIAEGQRFWPTLRQVTSQFPVRGNLVPPAHLAALLLEHGVERLYTRDRDFLKFPFLSVEDPFAG